MIDWDKPIETEEGVPARVISRDYKNGAGEVLVVAQIDYGAFSAIGHYTQKGETKYTPTKLRNRKTKREGWLNIYPDNSTGENIYETKDIAEKSSRNKIDTIKIEWEE